MLCHHHFLKFQGPLRLLASGGSSSDLYQGIGDVTHHFYLWLIQLINVGRAHIHMDNINFSLRIPLGRRILHNIITYRNHQISLFHNLILVILLRDADGPHGIRIIKRDYAFCHHRIDHRNLQLGGKLCQFLCGMAPHYAASCQNNRILCLENHACRILHGVKLRILLRRDFLSQRLFSL